MQKKPTSKGKLISVNTSEAELIRSVERILDHPNKSHLARLVVAHVPNELLLNGLLGDVPKNIFHKGQSLLAKASDVGSWDVNIPYSIQAGFMLNKTYTYVEFETFDPTASLPYTVFYKYKDDKNQTKEKSHKCALRSLLLVNGEEWPDDIEMDNLKASEVEY